jgi:hypothetical protein
MYAGAQLADLDGGEVSCLKSKTGAHFVGMNLK